MRRFLPAITALAFGVCVGMLVSGKPKVTPPPPHNNAATILISHPDPASPSGRRLVRLAALDPTKLPRNADDQLDLPPHCWMVTVAGVSHYGAPAD